MGLIWISLSTKLDKNYFKRIMLKWRMEKSMRRCAKAGFKLEKARKEREWIENSPHIHLLNYPYYKIKRKVKLK